MQGLREICPESNGLLQRLIEHTFLCTLFKKLTTSWLEKSVVRSTDSAHHYLHRGIK